MKRLPKFLKQLMFVFIVAFALNACAFFPKDSRDPSTMRDYKIQNKTENKLNYWIYYHDHNIKELQGRPAHCAGGEIPKNEKGEIQLDWGHGRYTILFQLDINESEAKEIDIVVKEKRKK